MGKICEGAPQSVWDAIAVRLKAHNLSPKHVDVMPNRFYKETVWCISFYTSRFYRWYFKSDGKTCQEPWK